ncbi:MAG: hypothetical protein RIQ47_746 [Bacteroidota bacterium]|jgi:hypothetical protein
MKNPKNLAEFLAGQTIVQLIDEYHYLYGDNMAYAVDETKALLKTYRRELGKRLRLSGPEVRAFIQIFKLSAWDGVAAKSDMTPHWEKDLSGAGELFKALQLLEMKGLILRKSSFQQKISFSIPPQVSKDVYNNRTPETHCTKVDAYGLADRINDIVQRIDNGQVDQDDAFTILSSVVDRNRELSFSKKFKRWNLAKEEGLLVAYLYANTLLDERTVQTDAVVTRLFGNSGRAKSISMRIQRKDGPLFAGNIICHADEEFQTGNRIMLSDETIAALFDEKEISRIKTSTVPQQLLPVIRHSNINHKQLHYNEREGKEIALLEKSLEQSAFLRIAGELKNHGLSQGLTVLLYGPPGTGKTESVLQLARATGRDIMKVDIASLRDKWVGESEKQVKRVFENYREQYNNTPLAPILLMNEADGIISSRTREVNHSSDQMHNAMQNILLEEMESFKGILMATTNFESKLDPAFERRFLHKIKIDLPHPIIRARIISDRIPFLTEAEAHHLAETFALSGGQLDNVTKKIVTSRLLTGNTPAFEEVCSWFESETLNGKKQRSQSIGFQLGKENLMAH